jgi:hypothetical protein
MEATNRGTTKVIDSDRIHLGMALNAAHTSFNRAEKVFTQARLLALIPIVGRCYIIVGFRLK